MDVVKAILSANSIVQAYKAVSMDFTKERYPYESLLIGFLSAYQLNSDKNKIKPKFENDEILNIFTHLVAETYELKYELNQRTIDYERVLNEVGDIAALCAGIIAWVVAHKNEKQGE